MFESCTGEINDQILSVFEAFLRLFCCVVEINVVECNLFSKDSVLLCNVVFSRVYLYLSFVFLFLPG